MPKKDEQIYGNEQTVGNEKYDAVYSERTHTDGEKSLTVSTKVKRARKFPSLSEMDNDLSEDRDSD